MQTIRSGGAALALILGGALLVAGCQQEQSVQQAGMAPPASAVALHAMSLDEAADLTASFRQANPGATSAGYFDRAVVDQILSEPGVSGVRVYHALNPDGTEALVVVGVDAQGNDLETGTIAEKSRPCPPFCGDGRLAE